MKYIFLFTSLLLLASSCKSGRNLSEVKNYTDEFVMPELKSTVNLHYQLNKNALNDTFNVIIDKYLQEDMILTASGMDVNLTKADDAMIELSGRKVLSRLPLEISVEKNTIFNKLKASGTLDLNFITEMQIDENWNFTTKTVLEHYEWLKEPNLSLGVFSIPVSSLANSIIEKSKSQLESQIDQSVNDQLSVRDKVLDFVKYFEEPIQIDTLLNSWLTVIPEYVHKSEILNLEHMAEGNITIQGRTKITDDKPVIEKLGTLPQFNWENDLDENSHLNFVFDIAYEKVNNYLNKTYRGQTFGDGNGKEITLHDIKILSDGSKLLAIASVTGSVNGDVHVSGIPVFDNDKQAFYADKVDIELKTNNVFHKAGAWLLKGKIKSQLSKLLSFSVEESLGDIQLLIDKQVAQYSQKDVLDLTAKINNLTINEFVLGADRIHAFVTINAYLHAAIHDIQVFNIQKPSPNFKN